MQFGKKNNVNFYYKFKFDSSYVIYIYEKDADMNVLFEELYINDEKLIYYNHDKKCGKVNLFGAETLKTNLNEKIISFISYIKNNAVLMKNDNNDVFNKFMCFVENMILCNESSDFDSDGNVDNYCEISKGIIQNNAIKDLEKFLSKIDVKYNLIEREIDGHKKILCNLNGELVNFFDIASKGTILLTRLFYNLLRCKNKTLIFIDAINLYYHNDSVTSILKELDLCQYRRH